MSAQPTGSHAPRVIKGASPAGKSSPGGIPALATSSIWLHGKRTTIDGHIYWLCDHCTTKYKFVRNHGGPTWTFTGHNSAKQHLLAEHKITCSPNASLGSLRAASEIKEKNSDAVVQAAGSAPSTRRTRASAASVESGISAPAKPRAQVIKTPVRLLLVIEGVSAGGPSAASPEVQAVAQDTDSVSNGMSSPIEVQIALPTAVLLGDSPVTAQSAQEQHVTTVVADSAFRRATTTVPIKDTHAPTKTTHKSIDVHDGINSDNVHPSVSILKHGRAAPDVADVAQVYLRDDDVRSSTGGPAMTNSGNPSEPLGPAGRNVGPPATIASSMDEPGLFRSQSNPSPTPKRSLRSATAAPTMAPRVPVLPVHGHLSSRPPCKVRRMSERLVDSVNRADTMMTDAHDANHGVVADAGISDPHSARQERMPPTMLRMDGTSSTPKVLDGIAAQQEATKWRVVYSPTRHNHSQNVRSSALDGSMALPEALPVSNTQNLSLAQATQGAAINSESITTSGTTQSFDERVTLVDTSDESDERSLMFQDTGIGSAATYPGSGLGIARSTLETEQAASQTENEALEKELAKIQQENEALRKSNEALRAQQRKAEEAWQQERLDLLAQIAQPRYVDRLGHNLRSALQRFCAMDPHDVDTIFQILEGYVGEELLLQQQERGQQPGCGEPPGRALRPRPVNE